MKNFFAVTVCAALLAVGSVASAASYTTTLSLSGTGQYLLTDNIEIGPVPTLWTNAPALDTYGPFFGVGEVQYDISWNIPDWNTAYQWTLDVDLSVLGGYSIFFPTNDINVGLTALGVQYPIDESFQGSFDLGQFALADYETAILTIGSLIEGLPNPGYDPNIGGYYLDGDWDSGLLSLALAVPILESLDSGILMDADVLFEGEISLTANDGPAPVPEPATMLLFGTGLAGLAGARRRKKK